MPQDPRERRRLHEARHREAHAARKRPITVERIVDTALELVARDGFEALTMRRVAGVLGTGPASLYAHVANKAHLDELMISRLCDQLVLPEPDAARWQEQLLDLCAQIRDQYLRYPGISRAGLAVVPTNPEALRVSEAMLGILLAGGVDPQTAAWGLDALTLYVDAYCLELSLWLREMDHTGGGWVVTHEDLLGRFDALSAAEFPLTKRYAEELTAGQDHDRFDFALGLMINGLAPSPEPAGSAPAPTVPGSAPGRSRSRPASRGDRSATARRRADRGRRS